MTSTELLAAFYRLFAQASTNAQISSTDAYLFISEAQDVLCLEKQQNLAEEPLVLVANQWEYAFPTPNATYSNPAGADSYSAVESIRWLDNATLNRSPVLEKVDYEEIVSYVYGVNTASLASNYGFSKWANNPVTAKFALYPIPDTAYAIAVSPMIVTYRVRPKAISAAQTTVFLNGDYHQSLVQLAVAYAMQSIHDERADYYESKAMRLFDSVRSGRNRATAGVSRYVSNKYSFRIPK